MTCTPLSSFSVRLRSVAAAVEDTGTRACAMLATHSGGVSVSVRHTLASHSCAHVAAPRLCARIVSSPTRARNLSASCTAINGV